ncbi:MAG: hypothetical protein IPJ52_09510 [Rhodocyclaceae bacterium]|nr:hypothetical protein [Rhodocyclaceae bacterium]
MKERPILFSGPMVRAILEGRKTQTRRIVKQCHMVMDHGEDAAGQCINAGYIPCFPLCPYGHRGDRLWVRETWTCVHGVPSAGGVPHPDDFVRYRADEGPGEQVITDVRCWHPVNPMPRVYSRILLEIVAVRVERLNEISGTDCIAEGIIEADAPQYVFGLHEAYRDLWESINGAGSWTENPWVWVVEFRRVTE